MTQKSTKELMLKIIALEDHLRAHPNCDSLEIIWQPQLVKANPRGYYREVMGQILFRSTNLKEIDSLFMNLVDCLRILRKLQRTYNLFGPRGRPRKTETPTL